MQAHIVHVHPEPASFNAALTQRARTTLEATGAAVTVSDLYASRFDPVEAAEHYRNRSNQATFSALAEQRHAWQTDTVPVDVVREVEALSKADLLVIQFPLWWHGPPAMLKGWFDRVFMNGGLYTSRKRYDAGHFRGRRAILSITTGAPEAAFGPGARGGDPETMLWPLQYSLHYMGFTVLAPFWTFGVQGHGYVYEQDDSLSTRLTTQLDRWQHRLETIGRAPTLAFPAWEDWDRQGQPLESTRVRAPSVAQS
ncbi:NAD(P)H-dependent oxidoreductase [Neoaquamicrobium sediminum]|uniref:NAD(P)H-dependent oxidoreductase n=1 Tax=Neoaquamicrobium sediminum TaxID=1849104 RepID=UPI004035BBC7